jgi:hypothetical protein
MEITISKESRCNSAGRPVVVVRDLDGSWHVMHGVTPVCDQAAGQWQFDGAAAAGDVTDAPEWLVALVEDDAPEDWRACRFEIRGISFSYPSAPSRDDSVLLSHMMASLDSERKLRKSLEDRLEKLEANNVDEKEAQDGEASGEGAEEVKPADAGGGSGRKRSAAGGVR